MADKVVDRKTEIIVPKLVLYSLGFQASFIMSITSRMIELLSRDDRATLGGVEAIPNGEILRFTYRRIPATITFTSEPKRYSKDYQGTIRLDCNVDEKSKDNSFYGTEQAYWENEAEVEPALMKIMEAVRKTRQLDSAKTRLVELFMDRGVSAGIVGDTVSTTRGEFRFIAKVSMDLGEIQGAKESAWWDLARGDYELAVRKTVDSVLGTNLFLELVKERFPSALGEIKECAHRLVEICQAQGLDAAVCTDEMVQISDKKTWLDITFSIGPSTINDSGIEGRISISGVLQIQWALASGEGYELGLCRLVDRLLGTKLEEKYDIAKYGFVPRETANKAAKWWANALRKEEPNLPPGTPLMAEVYASELSHILPGYDKGDRIGRFEAGLAEKLQTTIMSPFGITLSVDYNPCAMLYNCWAASDPESGDDGFMRFPCKTTMKITKEKIEVGSSLSKNKWETL